MPAGIKGGGCHRHVVTCHSSPHPHAAVTAPVGSGGRGNITYSLGPARMTRNSEEEGRVGVMSAKCHGAIRSDLLCDRWEWWTVLAESMEDRSDGPRPRRTEVDGAEGASLRRCRAYGWSEVQPKVQSAADPQNDSPAFNTEPSSRPCKLCACTSLLLARHSTKQGSSDIEDTARGAG